MNHKHIYYFLVAHLFLNLPIIFHANQNLPSPYCDVQEVLPFNGHGWYYNGVWVEQLMKHNKITTVIEIGSWLGCSTRHIASLLQPGGQLYAVDTWQGSIEHYEQEEFASMLPTLYDQFLSNIIHTQLTNIVIPIKMDSLQAVDFFKSKLHKVDLIYVDAAHDTESVLQDIEAYWPLVQNNGGILCGDDWWWDTVKVAVRFFAQTHRLGLYVGDNFWYLKPSDHYYEATFKDASLDIWKFDALQ